MTTCTHTLKKILLNNCEFYQFKLLFQRKASQLCTCVWGSRRRVRCSRRWLGGAASARSHQVRAATGPHHSHASPTHSNHAGFLYKLELCHRLWQIPPHCFVTGMTAKSNKIKYNNSFHTQVIEQKPIFYCLSWWPWPWPHQAQYRSWPVSCEVTHVYLNVLKSVKPFMSHCLETMATYKLTLIYPL